jgi:hypothetical protein
VIMEPTGKQKHLRDSLSRGAWFESLQDTMILRVLVMFLIPSTRILGQYTFPKHPLLRITA